MKQVLIKSGEAIVEEIPAPLVEPKTILVQVANSCVSVGTEMTGLKMSSLPLYKRALKQPENVKKVFEMIKNQGVKWTLDRVSGKLAAGSPTGYSAAGTVIAIGEQVVAFKVGDRVACAGAGIANHAEIINVPVNLVVKVPEKVDFKDASTVTLGSIALQGVRRTNPTLGETIVVIGLGVLGQITVQLLKANGCKVIGIDLDESRVNTAILNGLDKGCLSNSDLLTNVDLFTDGIGADAVIITASSESDSIVSIAMNVTRKKGRVVLVGDVGLNLKRADFYVKEIDFLISTSYGPGRYDPYYEIEGLDYPIGYVRWTENRNMNEYLYLISSGKININNFYSESVYDISKATQAFDDLKGNSKKPLMVLLQYSAESINLTSKINISPIKKEGDKINVAIVGAGSFALGMHLPNIQKLNKYFNIYAVMSRTGSNAKAIAQQYNAKYATTNLDDIINDDNVDLVLVTTRHNLHASIVEKCLVNKKAVFVEKPLALNQYELAEIKRVSQISNNPILITGFNRRFAPLISPIKNMLKDRKNPMIINYVMNAGFIAKDHWVHSNEGGGRNIGEACHIYDLFNSLTESKHRSVNAFSINVGGGKYLKSDNFNVTITYEDGSICNLIYSALGNKNFPKEEMTIFYDGNIIRLTDFKNLETYGIKQSTINKSVMDKGQFDLLRLTAQFISGESFQMPISLDEQFRATEISFIVENLIN